MAITLSELPITRYKGIRYVPEKSPVLKNTKIYENIIDAAIEIKIDKEYKHTIQTISKNILITAISRYYDSRYYGYGWRLDDKYLLDNEIWKPYIDRNIHVSNFGRIKCIGCDNTIHTGGKCQGKHPHGGSYFGGDLKHFKGYATRYDDEAMYIDELVAKLFIPNPQNYTLIRHKDINPLHNNIANLEWSEYI